MSEQLQDLVTQIETRTRQIYEEHLAPIATRFEFEGPPPHSETSAPPMVLFLGNHSAGKSSFINHLVGEQIQRTGIAPIDDGFTVITHGEVAEVKDGMSVVTNPKLAWNDLERFGPQLVSHLKMVVHPNPGLHGIALIDSPGMIDAADGKVDRGYNFPEVVRWFAERADVILFLFDPDKPGTTGETLKILTESLMGLDHKLLLIFNKVDRFESMRDYARAYGALCWNLSKAIPRKDLPHIFNTYLPDQGASPQSGVPTGDFDKQTEEVRREVSRAPFRRVDNVISRLYQHARRMRVHVRVLDHRARERFWLLLRYGVLGGAVALLGVVGLYLVWSYASQDHFGSALLGVLAVILVGACAVTALFLWDRRRLNALSLDQLFESTFARELTLGDNAEDLRAVWASVRERVRRALETGKRFPRARRAEFKRLEKVITKSIPALRLKAAESTKVAETQFVTGDHDA
ncbi:MAG: dynamin family protein [Planctomycetes bacterium]|nr:dynamin family protein [Planctomycetota bacterium]